MSISIDASNLPSVIAQYSYIRNDKHTSYDTCFSTRSAFHEDICITLFCVKLMARMWEFLVRSNRCEQLKVYLSWRVRILLSGWSASTSTSFIPITEAQLLSLDSTVTAQYVTAIICQQVCPRTNILLILLFNLLHFSIYFNGD